MDRRTRTPRRPLELKFKGRRPIRNEEKYCTKRMEEKAKQPQYYSFLSAHFKEGNSVIM